MKLENDRILSGGLADLMLSGQIWGMHNEATVRFLHDTKSEAN